MGDVGERLPLPRLVLRVGALGDRRFGREGGIDEAPEAVMQAARAACSEVMGEIATAVAEVFVADLAHVAPPLERPWRFWWETRWGLFFGRTDPWGRRAAAGNPAPAFRDDAPLVTVLAGREPGGGAFVAEAALAMNPAAAPPADSTERYVLFESVAVVVEDPDAPPSSRPVENPRTLSVGTIPNDADASGARALARGEARARADVARRRAFGFRAQSVALRHHADLLVAVWDPDAQGATGGTDEDVAAALAEHVPVVAIRLRGLGAAAVHLLETPADLTHAPEGPWQGALKECVRQILAFPDTDPARAAGPVGPPSARGLYRAFLAGPPPAAPWPARNWAPLQGWMDGKRTFASAAAGLLGIAGKATLAAPAPAPPSEPARPSASYERAQKRAATAAEAFELALRGGLVTAYVLGTLAVLLALLGLPLPHTTGWVWIAGILGLLGLGALLVVWALWRTATLEGWREAAADARLLAEALGCMEHLASLGVRVPLATSATRTAGRGDEAIGPGRRWSIWYFRALVREAPLRLPLIPRVPLTQQRDHLVDAWIGDPVADRARPGSHAARHRDASTAYRRLARGVTRATVVVFVVVLAAALLQFLVLPVDGLQWLSWVLLAVLLLGPALVAALAGFAAHVDAVRVSRRSDAVLQALAERARALSALDLADRESADARWRLATEAALAAEVMVAGAGD